MGTDSGTPMNFHTEALWREIKAHVDMGMSPQRAISALTRVDARILGGGDLGTIEPGKLADGSYDRWDPWIMERNLLEKVNAISARQLLMAGITTAVDLGAQMPEIIRTRDRIASGEIPGPRMLMSGPWITFPLARQLSAGAGVSGQGSRHPRRPRPKRRSSPRPASTSSRRYPMSRAHYQKVVEVAHKHRLRVHAHVYDEDLVRDAFEAGIETS